MHGYIKRSAKNKSRRALARSPIVAILGPRQCGKSNGLNRGFTLHPLFIYSPSNCRRTFCPNLESSSFLQNSLKLDRLLLRLFRDRRRLRRRLWPMHILHQIIENI